MHRISSKSKQVCLAALLLCSSLLGSTGCGEEAALEADNVVVVAEPSKEEAVYATAAVSYGDVVKTATIRCHYQHTDEQEITTAMIGKKVEEIYVRENDKVTKGQLIASLSGGDRQDQIDELEYRIAKNELLLSYLDTDENDALSYRWWSYLYQTSMSDSDKEKLDRDLEAIHQEFRYKREDYEDSIKLDRQQLALYRQEMDQCMIYADCDGKVFKVNDHLIGSTLTKESTLVKIFDTSQCIFQSTRTEYAYCFQEGEPVELSVATSGNTLVFDVIPAEPEKWDETLIFRIPPEEAESLAAGIVGTITITIDSRKNVLTVPKKAVHWTRDGKKYVYILDENNIRQMKWVETGLEGDSLTEIISGLKEGESILLK